MGISLMPSFFIRRLSNFKNNTNNEGNPPEPLFKNDDTYMLYNYYICFLGTAIICLLLEWKNPWKKKVYQGKEYLHDLFFFIFNTYVMIPGVVPGPLGSKFNQLEEASSAYPVRYVQGPSITRSNPKPLINK